MVAGPARRALAHHSTRSPESPVMNSWIVSGVAPSVVTVAGTPSAMATPKLLEQQPRVCGPAKVVCCGARRPKFSGKLAQLRTAVSFFYCFTWQNLQMQESADEVIPRPRSLCLTAWAGAKRPR